MSPLPSSLVHCLGGTLEVPPCIGQCQDHAVASHTSRITTDFELRVSRGVGTLRGRALLDLTPRPGGYRVGGYHDYGATCWGAGSTWNRAALRSQWLTVMAKKGCSRSDGSKASTSTFHTHAHTHTHLLYAVIAVICCEGLATGASGNEVRE